MSSLGRTLLVLLACATSTRAGNILYVRASAPANGDGSSWAKAFAELQPALAVAHAGDQVWVAQGTYTPAAGGLDKDAVFEIPDGAQLLGGFEGDELTPGQRDPATHESLLSGDLLGDDSLGPGHDGDNSHLILRASKVAPGTLLDGFTIQGGRHAAGFTTGAAGLSVKQGHLVIRRCSFVDNFGAPGAIYCSGAGSSVVDQCLFLGNRSSNHSAGIYVLSNDEHEILVRNSRFVGNQAGGFGGAIETLSSVATIEGCLFSGNVTLDNLGTGGAIYSEASTLTIRGCSFSANRVTTTKEPGAAVFAIVGEATISDSVLWGDEAQKSVDGEDEIKIGQGTTATVDHCLIENWAGQYPGLANSGLNPLYVDPDGADGVAGTADDDLRLSPGSPAIDSGDNLSVPADVFDSDGDGNVLEADPLDVRGVNRFEDDPDTPDAAGSMAPVVDRGALEFSRWTDLGHALGVADPPHLVGIGSWKPAEPLGLVITGVLPLAPGVLIVGEFELDAPFKGGVLVPHPLFANAIVADAIGRVTVQGLLPADAPPGFETFMQAWFFDAAGPNGAIATNAVSGKTP